MGEQKQTTIGSKEDKTSKQTAGDQKPSAAVDAPPTKMQIATEIYKRMRTVRDVTRKDIIEKFIAEVKLTKSGASTYYQMIKAKHEPMGKK